MSTFFHFVLDGFVRSAETDAVVKYGKFPSPSRETDIRCLRFMKYLIAVGF